MILPALWCLTDCRWSRGLAEFWNPTADLVTDSNGSCPVEIRRNKSPQQMRSKLLPTVTLCPSSQRLLSMLRYQSSA